MLICHMRCIIMSFDSGDWRNAFVVSVIMVFFFHSQKSSGRLSSFGVCICRTSWKNQQFKSNWTSVFHQNIFYYLWIIWALCLFLNFQNLLQTLKRSFFKFAWLYLQVSKISLESELCCMYHFSVIWW